MHPLKLLLRPSEIVEARSMMACYGETFVAGQTTYDNDERIR
ncbi:MAG: hypothetical protein ABWW70_06260 [Thermoproteota archaeon]